MTVYPCFCKWNYFVPFYGRVLFHCIYVWHLLYSSLCRWAFMLLLCLGYWNSASMNIGVHEWKLLSCIQLFTTPWVVAHQSLCPWNFPVSEWNNEWVSNGVSGHSLLQGNLPDAGIESRSLALQADSLLSEPPGKPHRSAYILSNYGSLQIYAQEWDCWVIWKLCF